MPEARDCFNVTTCQGITVLGCRRWQHGSVVGSAPESAHFLLQAGDGGVQMWCPENGISQWTAWAGKGEQRTELIVFPNLFSLLIKTSTVRPRNGRFLFSEAFGSVRRAITTTEGYILNTGRSRIWRELWKGSVPKHRLVDVSQEGAHPTSDVYWTLRRKGLKVSERWQLLTLNILIWIDLGFKRH